MWITELIVRIPSKIDVDKSVENKRNFPHFPHGYVEKWDVHTLSTRFQQGDVDKL